METKYQIGDIVNIRDRRDRKGYTGKIIMIDIYKKNIYYPAIQGL